MKSEKISQNPSFDNFLKNKKWKVIDTANERSVAGLSFAVSTSIWAHAVQKLFPYVIPVGKTTQTSGMYGTIWVWARKIVRRLTFFICCNYSEAFSPYHDHMSSK